MIYYFKYLAINKKKGIILNKVKINKVCIKI